jgi:putative phosphoesterase
LKKIGLLSDTHGHIDDRILHHLQDRDEIWHAGDIGNAAVIETLEKTAPVRAVYGNIDGTDIRKNFPEYIHEVIENTKILIIHIAGPFGKYNPKTSALLRELKPDILICGHSHILKVQWDPSGFLYMNPGAAGKTGFHTVITLLRFQLKGGKPENLELIELGPRAERTK